jgi:hypothetical protein
MEGEVFKVLGEGIVSQKKSNRNNSRDLGFIIYDPGGSGVGSRC